MLSDEQIRQLLHACRVVPLVVAKPHGPLGLEQLAAAVSGVNPALGSGASRARRPIALDHATWEKLEELAKSAAHTTSQHVTAAQVAAAIIQQFLATLPRRDKTQK